MLDPRYAAIIHDWADELASVLGRSASEIREKGLYVGDFPHQVVEIEFDDESSARFRWAFYIESRSKKAVGVFTEHCGYFVLPIVGVKITKTDLWFVIPGVSGPTRRSTGAPDSIAAWYPARG
jgi:hypothetical protein